MSERPALRLHVGGGDIVGYLEDLLERARAGEWQSLAVASVDRDGVQGVGFVWREDMPAPFSLILASVACMQHDLIEGGLVS